MCVSEIQIFPKNPFLFKMESLFLNIGGHGLHIGVGPVPKSFFLVRFRPFFVIFVNKSYPPNLCLHRTGLDKKISFLRQTLDTWVPRRPQSISWAVADPSANLGFWENPWRTLAFPPADHDPRLSRGELPELLELEESQIPPNNPKLPKSGPPGTLWGTDKPVRSMQGAA